MSNDKGWQSYWAAQTTPRHRYDTEEHYRQVAAEMRTLFGDRIPQSVLEVGCGSGSLYEYLGFASTAYKGVDFSQSLLDVFREHHPEVDLVFADAHCYRDEQRYDLIFSHAVLQYFDRDMVAVHFDAVRSMMDSNSLFVCAAVPWKAKRFGYFTGELSGAVRPNWLAGAGRYIKSRIQSRMGTWHSPYDLRRLAASHGLKLQLFGSMTYAYRFHAVISVDEC